MAPGNTTSKPAPRIKSARAGSLNPVSFLGEAQKILLGRQESFRKELQRIQKEWSPDSIHDVRVACRRFRSTLRVFAPMLDPAFSLPIDKALKRFMKKFNTLRDCDVHIELLDSIRKPSLRRTQNSISNLRSIFHGDKEALDGELKAFIDTSGEFAEFPFHKDVEVGRRRHDGALQADPVPIFLESAFNGLTVPTKMLVPELEEVKRRQSEVNWLKPSESDESLHSLRVQIKRLRYGFEIFQTSLGARETGPLLARLKKIQDLLGWIHDCDTLNLRLRTLLLSRLKESYRATRRDIRGRLGPSHPSPKPKTKTFDGSFQQAIFYVFRRVSRQRGSYFSEARRIFIHLERMQWHETLFEWLVSGKCPPIWKKLAEA